MEVIKKYKNISLIKIDENNYCVQREYKNLLRQNKIDFYCLNRNGLTFTYDSLCNNITIGEYERCNVVCNANCIMKGLLAI